MGVTLRLVLVRVPEKVSNSEFTAPTCCDHRKIGHDPDSELCGFIDRGEQHEVAVRSTDEPVGVIHQQINPKIIHQ